MRNYRYNVRCPDCNQFMGEGHSCPVAMPQNSHTWTENEDGAVLEVKTDTIRTLEQLLEEANVDLSEWYVDRYVINKWDQASRERVVECWQVKVFLKPLKPVQDVTKAFIDKALEVLEAGPRWVPPTVKVSTLKLRPEPVLYVPSIYDPHIGMLAWHEEVGENYDSSIAARDYMNAVDKLMEPAAFYNVDRILYVIGNDLLHVDALGPNGRGGQTTKGTPQDIDSRLAEMADVACECLIYGIESALEAAPGPVDVVVVKGNHDQERMYMIGKFIDAYYRNESRVTVDYSPLGRKYYQYGVNLIGMTHGMEAKRTRDSLPLIMATEVDPEMWADTVFRDWLVGHHHTRFVLKYLDQFETRGVRVHALPGLTTEDYWHYSQGYSHRRSAEAHVFSSTGGHCGHHSFNLEGLAG